MNDYYMSLFHDLKAVIENKQRIKWFAEKYDTGGSDDILVNVQLFYDDKIHDFTLSTHYLWRLFNFLEEHYETEINDIIKE